MYVVSEGLKIYISAIATLRFSRSMQFVVRHLFLVDRGDENNAANVFSSRIVTFTLCWSYKKSPSWPAHGPKTWAHCSTVQLLGRSRILMPSILRSSYHSNTITAQIQFQPKVKKSSLAVVFSSWNALNPNSGTLNAFNLSPKTRIIDVPSITHSRFSQNSQFESELFQNVRPKLPFLLLALYALTVLSNSNKPSVRRPKLLPAGPLLLNQSS